MFNKNTVEMKVRDHVTRKSIDLIFLNGVTPFLTEIIFYKTSPFILVAVDDDDF